MKVIALICAAVTCARGGLIAPAATLVRSPAHDSAVIQSHRLGGNFAYRTDESHAYTALHPVVSTIRQPVGVSFSHGAPIVRSSTIQHHVVPAAGYATYPHLPVVYSQPEDSEKAEDESESVLPVTYSSVPLSYSNVPISYSNVPISYSNALPYSSGIHAAYPHAIPATYGLGYTGYTGYHPGFGFSHGFPYGVPVAVEKEEQPAEESVIVESSE